MNEKELKLVSLLIDITDLGKIAWERNYSSYEATVGTVELRLNINLACLYLGRSGRRIPLCEITGVGDLIRAADAYVGKEEAEIVEDLQKALDSLRYEAGTEK